MEQNIYKAAITVFVPKLKIGFQSFFEKKKSL